MQKFLWPVYFVVLFGVPFFAWIGIASNSGVCNEGLGCGLLIVPVLFFLVIWILVGILGLIISLVSKKQNQNQK